LIEAGQRVISREEFDRVEAAYEVAVERLNEADWQLRLMEKGSRAEQIESARAALEEAEANYEVVKKQEKIERAEARKKQAEAALRLAETRLGYATLRAPLSGVVLSENVEPGEYVAPGTPVVTVGDLENVWLRAYIQETDLGRVKLGQEARLTTDTYPDKAYRGRVSFIASEAEFTPKNVQTQEERVKLVYRIKIDVPNPDMELKPGMPADAEILVEAASSPGD
jgi:HlyD family secretion protein